MNNSTKNNDILGSIYKDLRTSKGFSQLEAVGDSISVSSLSEFERGKSGLSARNFFSILQNINVSTAEFQHTYNNSLSSKDLLLYDSQVTQAYLDGNIKKLKFILAKLESAIELSPNNKKFRLDKVGLEATITLLDSNFQTPLQDIVYLKNYLLNLKEWGKYEILLLGRCSKIFDVFTLSLLVHRMISPIQMNYNLHYTRHAMIQTTLTLISEFLEQNQLKLAAELIDYLDHIEIFEYYMYEKITLIYSKAMLDYKSGDKSALQNLKKCQAILEFTECFKTAELVELEIKQLTQESD